MNEYNNGDSGKKIIENSNKNENNNIFQTILSKANAIAKLKNLNIQRKSRNLSKIQESPFDEIIHENIKYKIPQGYSLRCISNIELALMNHRLNIEQRHMKSEVNKSYFFPRNEIIQESIEDEEILETEKCIIK